MATIAPTQMDIHSSIWFWENVPAAVLKEMTDRLPPFRMEKALSYVFDRDRLLCAKAYLMLKELLEKHYGIRGNPEFRFGPGGKPYLKDIEVFFNQSHCPAGVLCVVGGQEVGCDIEEIFPSLDMDLCKACFNDREIDAICSSDKPNVEFARLWTMKEAYMKLTGEGLSDCPRDILSESVLSKVSFHSQIHADKGCVSTIAFFFG